MIRPTLILLTLGGLLLGCQTMSHQEVIDLAISSCRSMGKTLKNVKYDQRTNDLTVDCND